MALQLAAQIHFSLSGNPRDLVLRLRLWRQCAAGKEVSCVAHRVGAGARRGVVGRAYVDPEIDQPARRSQIRHRSVSLGLWKNKPGDADLHSRRVESRNYW